MRLSLTDKVAEILGWILLGILWCMAVYSYGRLPEIIPVHYRHGVADGYGDKSGIFDLPIVGTVLFIALTVLNRFPHIFNYVEEITSENAESQYYSMTRILRFLKLFMVGIFILIVFKTVKN